MIHPSHYLRPTCIEKLKGSGWSYVGTLFKEEKENIGTFFQYSDKNSVPFLGFPGRKKNLGGATII